MSSSGVEPLRAGSNKVPRYQDIPESDWEQVERWFNVQLERGKKKS